MSKVSTVNLSKKVPISKKFNFKKGVDACFKFFDENDDQKIDRTEFMNLCENLFQNELKESYVLEEEKVFKIFKIFDIDQDGLLDWPEFLICWNKWIEVIVNPKVILLVLHVQNDFINGSNKIDGGEDIVFEINKLQLLNGFKSVFYVQKWHPGDHISFIENLCKRKLASTNMQQIEKGDIVVFEGQPVRLQQIWPKHCIMGTWGAHLASHLGFSNSAAYFYSGTDPEVDDTSALVAKEKISKLKLLEELKLMETSDVVICGFCFDTTVRDTALDCLKNGLRTIVVENCCIGLNENEVVQTKNDIFKKHGVVTHSGKVGPLIEGKDRRFDLGYHLAKYLKGKLRRS